MTGRAAENHAVSRFDRLYRDNFPFVWATAHRCGAPSRMVGDVVREVFLVVFTRLDELRWEISPRGWLYGVTRQATLRFRSNPTHVAQYQRDAAGPLTEILGLLQESERELFMMAQLLDMSDSEISAELALPVEVVTSRLREAEEHLTAAVGTARLVAELRRGQESDRPSLRDQEQTYAAMVPLIASSWLWVRSIASTVVRVGAVPLAALLLPVVSYVATASYNATVRADEAAEVEEALPPPLRTPPRGSYSDPPAVQARPAAKSGMAPAAVEARSPTEPGTADDSGKTPAVVPGTRAVEPGKTPAAVVPGTTAVEPGKTPAAVVP